MSRQRILGREKQEEQKDVEGLRVDGVHAKLSYDAGCLIADYFA